MNWLLGPLVVVIVFVAAVLRGHTTLAVFSAVLALAILVSEVWARVCLSGLTYRRRLDRDHVSVGEQVTLELEFVNLKPLPLAWLLVRDRFPDGLALAGPLADGSNATPEWLTSLLSLRWYERVVRRVPLHCTARGAYSIGPAELSSGDVFGYRRVQREQRDTVRLVVYPRVFGLAELAIAAGIPQGEAAFWRRLGPDPMRFSQVRDYRPGDSPRYIHWRATARKGVLQTKEFEPSASRMVIIALDVQTMERPYEYAPAYLEFAISAAASLAMASLEARWQTGLITNGPGPDGSPWQYIAPSRHPQQAVDLLSTLAALTPFRGDSFDAMLGALQAQLPAGASLVCVSAHLRPEILQMLQAFRRAQHPVSLFAIGETNVGSAGGVDVISLGGLDAWQRLQTLAVD